jgi:hypothetical protein
MRGKHAVMSQRQRESNQWMRHPSIFNAIEMCGHDGPIEILRHEQSISDQQAQSTNSIRSTIVAKCRAAAKIRVQEQQSV